MRFHTLKKWENLQELEGMAYLCQLFEELLFDYSLDTYKASALNSCYLAAEARQVVADVIDEAIDKSHLKHVIDELEQSCRKDEAAQTLLGPDLESYFRALRETQHTASSQEPIIELIFRRLNSRNYQKILENLMLEVVPNPREKNRARRLARNYVTHLQNRGYSNNYIYPLVRSHFHGTRKINGFNHLEEFFTNFSGEKKSYVAVFCASDLFLEISSSCDSLGLVVAKELEEYKDLIGKANFALDIGQVYVATKPFDSVDPHTARKIAETKIETASTLTILYHHKEKASWSSECLLIDVEASATKKSHPAINTMHKCVDMKKGKAAKSLNALIRGFRMSSQSFAKFDRAVALHSLALTSESQENQLLNLWIALETLVPSNIGRSKISQINDGIMPFLGLSYFPRLLERLVSDIFIWNKGVIHFHLKDVPGASTSKKLARVLLLQEYEQKKGELYGSFKDFYLLRNRCHSMESFLKKPSDTSRSLEMHRQRIEWHLRRIYRTRNMIVHSGRTPLYVDVLIENLHDYVDTVMSKLVDFSINGGQANTLEQGFQLAEIKWRAHLDRLKSAEQLTEDNIDQIVFCNET